MNNTKIEKKAVREVENLFLDNSSNVSTEIEKGDKGISFDGNLIIFSDEHEKKSSYLGKIPLQVKGTEVEQLSEQKAKFYDFDKHTFKNFQLEDGVVIFLVQILKGSSKSTRIFYKFLDVMELQDILDTIEDKSSNQRVVELELIDENSNLNKIFYNILAYRKQCGYEDAKLNKYNGVNEIEHPFDKFIVEKKRKQMNLYEYQSVESYLNKQLKKEFQNIFSENIYFDSKELAIIIMKIKQLDNINELPSENKNMASILLAMYEVTTENITESKKHLEVVDKNLYSNYVFRIELEYFCREKNYELFSKWLKENIFEERLLNLYELYYFLTNNMYENFIKLYKKINSTKTIDYRFLYGKYLMLTFNFEEAYEVLNELFEDTNNFEIQLDAIQSMFYKTLNRDDYDVDDLNKILNELKKLKNEIEKINNINMPAIDDLEFEIMILIDPSEGINRIDDLLKQKNESANYEYLRNKKLTLLMELNDYSQVLKLIDSIADSEISDDLRAFRLMSLYRLKKFEEFNIYADILLKEKNNSKNDKLYNLLLELYLLKEKNNLKTDNQSFENTISKIIKNIDISFLNISLLEEVRKEKNSIKYKQNLSIIKEKVVYLNELELERLKVLLINLEEDTFTEEVYSKLSKINEVKADEICFPTFFKLGKNKKCEIILNKYQNNELSEILLTYKLNYLLKIEEFNIINYIYKETTIRNPEILNIFLTAKLISRERFEVEEISRKLYDSTNIDYRMNASIAFIEFDINLKLGVQFIEKMILKKQFNNEEFNQQFFSVFFRNLNKLEKNREIDTFDGDLLRLCRLKIDSKVKNYLFLPDDWEISLEKEDVDIVSLTNELSIISNGLVVGECVRFNNHNYELVEETNLSTYIIRHIMSLNSGGVDSDKPFKMITVDEGFSELTEFLLKLDRSETYEDLKELNNLYHSPMMFEKLQDKEKVVELYLSIMRDKSIIYFSGGEMDYDESSRYQVSLISLIYLANLNLLHIIDDYENLYFETTQIENIQNILNNDLDSVNEGRIYILDGELGYYKQSDKEISENRNLLKSLILNSKKMKKNRSGIVNNELRKLDLFDNVSIQSAINNNLKIFYDDESIQNIVRTEFNIEAGNIGTLISDYFLEKEKNLDGFLDVLLQVLREKNAWIIKEDTLINMYSLKYQNDKNLNKKFNIWLKEYVDYFQ